MKESHSAGEMTRNWRSGNWEGTSPGERNWNLRTENWESNSNREMNWRFGSQTRHGTLRGDCADLAPRNQRVVYPKLPSQTSHETSELGRYDAQLQKSVLWQRCPKPSWAEAPVNQAAGGSHGHYGEGGSGRYGIASSWVGGGGSL